MRIFVLKFWLIWMMLNDWNEWKCDRWVIDVCRSWVELKGQRSMSTFKMMENSEKMHFSVIYSRCTISIVWVRAKSFEVKVKNTMGVRVYSYAYRVYILSLGHPHFAWSMLTRPSAVCCSMIFVDWKLSFDLKFSWISDQNDGYLRWNYWERERHFLYPVPRTPHVFLPI